MALMKVWIGAFVAVVLFLGMQSILQQRAEIAVTDTSHNAVRTTRDYRDTATAIRPIHADSSAFTIDRNLSASVTVGRRSVE